MTLPSAGCETHAAPVRRKLRIAVLNRAFSPTAGGAERYSIAMVEQLAPLHEIHVFAQEIHHQWPNVIYHQVFAPLRKPRWINQLWFSYATWRQTRRGFDVVHSHENTWHGDVQTVHVLPVRHTLFHGREGARLVSRWAKVMTSPRLLAYLLLEHWRYAYRAGRQVVVTSGSLRAIMSAAYPACGEMLRVITPGIKMPALPVSPQRKADARARLGLPSVGTCLLFVANDYRKKGLHTLLDALARLPADVVLAIVGNAAQALSFRNRITALSLAERIFFLGSLDNVDPAYEAADCLVHPTLEDTFAMVVLEALAHGLPVIVSGPEFCGISGLLQHGNNAMILENPKDAPLLARTILEVTRSPALAGRLAQGATEFAKNYQWRDRAAQQESLYFQVEQEKSQSDMVFGA